MTVLDMAHPTGHEIAFLCIGLAIGLVLGVVVALLVKASYGAEQS